MNRLLVLFANSFPYNISEPFLETEYPLYKDYFDKVLVVTACKKGETPTRQTDGDILEILPDYTLSRDLRSILGALPWMLTDGMFYRELNNLIFHRGFSVKKLYDLVVLSLCGNHRAKQAFRWMKKHPEYAPQAVYSYWLHIPAYAAVRLGKKLKGRCPTVSRAHGFDVYWERHATGYIPFHQQLFDRLDLVAPICNDGKAYLEGKYGRDTAVAVHRLGAADRGFRNPVSSRETLEIVSCARTIPLKRLDRIVDAVCLLDRPVHWTHLGGGEAQEALEAYAAEKLPPHVNATFTRTIPNAEVYERYKNDGFHVFVNVSETEGAPVSIMEAMSFGIPVIATAVGGTPELIDEGVNGYLLPKDFTDDALASLLKQIAQMPDGDYRSLRRGARCVFEQRCDAVKNYRIFVENVLAAPKMEEKNHEHQPRPEGAPQYPKNDIL